MSNIPAPNDDICTYNQRIVENICILPEGLVFKSVGLNDCNDQDLVSLTSTISDIAKTEYLGRECIYHLSYGTTVTGQENIIYNDLITSVISDGYDQDMINSLIANEGSITMLVETEQAYLDQESINSQYRVKFNYERAGSGGFCNMYPGWTMNEIYYDSTQTQNIGMDYVSKLAIIVMSFIMIFVVLYYLFMACKFKKRFKENKENNDEDMINEDVFGSNDTEIECVGMDSEIEAFVDK